MKYLDLFVSLLILFKTFFSNQNQKGIPNDLVQKQKEYGQALNQKEWVVLVDGDLNQIKKFKKFSKKFGLKLTIIFDIIHVLGYLCKAGKVLNDQDKLENWISSKLILILDGKSSFVASGIRRTATCRDLDKKTREPIDT